MNYYFDTEFFEDGPGKPIQLISLGIVSEDGREFYIENSDVDLSNVSDWLKENVLPHLSRSAALPHKEIGEKVLGFLASDPCPMFWAYFADYDWVLFAQLFGRMIDLPRHFPQFAMDLKQELVRRKLSRPKIPMTGTLHNALADARWNRDLHAWLRRNE